MRQELKNAFGKVFITISVDHRNRWVHTNWVGYLTEENIKAGALAYTRAVAEAGFHCVLNDTSQVVGGWDHSLDWVVSYWGPEAVKAGIKHFAIIITPQSFAETSASNFYANLKSFDIKVFDNKTHAEAWLRPYALAPNNFKGH
jgi:hypothetical protein